MSYPALIGTVALVHILAAMSPGPDFVIAVRNSLTYSRKTGLWTALGISLGIAVHIFYSVAGLAFIISKSIILFSVIKFLGSGYLIYIGLKSIFGRSSKIVKVEKRKKDILALEALRMGFLTNVLNPKATLFFLGLFSFIISPDTPYHILSIMSIMMIVNTALWFALVAIFFTHHRIQAVFNKFQKFFNKFLGGLLIALGVKIAISSD